MTLKIIASLILEFMVVLSMIILSYLLIHICDLLGITGLKTILDLSNSVYVLVYIILAAVFITIIIQDSHQTLLVHQDQVCPACGKLLGDDLTQLEGFGGQLYHKKCKPKR